MITDEKCKIKRIECPPLQGKNQFDEGALAIAESECYKCVNSPMSGCKYCEPVEYKLMKLSYTSNAFDTIIEKEKFIVTKCGCLTESCQIRLLVKKTCLI